MDEIPVTAERLFAKIGQLVIENEVLREQNAELKRQLEAKPDA